jgi:hypothetical protein
MRIEWVNHAGFVLEHGPVRLLCDPWLEGYAFDNSWALLSPTKFSYGGFANVTNLWFSHEHPDHFSPPNLKKVPPEARKRITVLFQRTGDERVVDFCRGLGFGEVVELPERWHTLPGGLELLCRPVGRGDSWLAAKAGGKCLLNLNDCIYLSEEDLRPVREEVGPVDVLLTQFSYASWWGNEEDDAAWKQAALDQLEKVRREVNVLAPRHVLLCASFVSFCHRENAYMNRHANTIHDAYRYVKGLGKAEPLVLYPGDPWQVGEPHDSSPAMERYAADYARALSQPSLVEPAEVQADALAGEADRFLQTLWKHNSRLLLRRLPPARILLTDHGDTYELSLRGLRPARTSTAHDIALSSGALSYCLRFPWGGETLTINGRFRAPLGGDHHRFFRWTSVAQANSLGVCYDFRYYVRKAAAKVLRLANPGVKSPVA